MLIIRNLIIVLAAFFVSLAPLQASMITLTYDRQEAFPPGALAPGGAVTKATL